MALVCLLFFVCWESDRHKREQGAVAKTGGACAGHSHPQPGGSHVKIGWSKLGFSAILTYRTLGYVAIDSGALDASCITKDCTGAARG